VSSFGWSEQNYRTDQYSTDSTTVTGTVDMSKITDGTPAGVFSTASTTPGTHCSETTLQFCRMELLLRPCAHCQLLDHAARSSGREAVGSQ
jgi:hypothetical protein